MRRAVSLHVIMTKSYYAADEDASDDSFHVAERRSVGPLGAVREDRTIIRHVRPMTSDVHNFMKLFAFKNSVKTSLKASSKISRLLE